MPTMEARLVSGIDSKNAPSVSLPRALGAGALAGQLAGLIMAGVVMAVFVLFLGKGLLYPVQVIGSFIFGDQAIPKFHLGALVAGLLLHQLGPALFWGLVLSVVAWKLRIRRGAQIALVGAAIGVVSQLVDVHLILPVAYRALHGHDIWAEQVPVFWSWAAHLVFGLSLSIYPWVYGKIDWNSR